jgi:hypothetical protein
MCTVGQLVIIDGNKEPFEFKIAYGEKNVLIGSYALPLPPAPAPATPSPFILKFFVNNNIISDVRCQIKIHKALPFHARITVDSKKKVRALLFGNTFLLC